MHTSRLLSILLLAIGWTACSTSSVEPIAATPSTTETAPPPEKSYTDFDIIHGGVMDANGVLWFSSTLGLLRVEGEKVTRLTTDDGLSTNRLTSILADSKGRIVLGTYDGVDIYDGHRFEHIDLPSFPKDTLWEPVFTGRTVIELFEDQSQNLWFGTYGSGVYNYDGSTLTPYLHEAGQTQVNGAYHNAISGIEQDRSGHMWFTSQTHGGVQRWDGDQWTHWDLENGLKEDMMLCIHESADGMIWVGVLGNEPSGGLHRWDGNEWRVFTEADGLDNPNVNRIFEDHEGRLWLISQRSNLKIFENGTFKTFEDVFPKAEAPDLSDMRFRVEDAEGNIWMGGRYGKLYRFNPSTQTFTDFTRAK